MGLFLSQVINGLSNSAELFLVAVGMVIIFGMLDVCNMAHGEFIMIGAYAEVVLMKQLQVPFAVTLIAAFLISAVIGAVVEHLLIRKLYGKVAETLLVTFALTYITQQICRMIFGPEGQNVEVPIPGYISFGKVTIPYYNIFLFVMAFVVLAITLLLMYRTSYGVQLRAVTQNRAICQCFGINTGRIDKVTFAFGCGLAGLAGALIAPVSSITPSMGTGYIVDSLMVVILGGLGSVFGSLLSSFVIEEAVTVMAGYMSQVTAKLLVFVLIIIIVRFKPYGLFSSKDRR